MPDAVERILLKRAETPGYGGSLADYEAQGGYQALRKTLGEYKPRRSSSW